MRRRRSAEEIKELVEKYEASGLTQIEYCRQTGMVLSTLGRYLRHRCNQPQQLIRVEVESAREQLAGFVLVLANGRRIETGWGFEDADLARVILVAESA